MTDTQTPARQGTTLAFAYVTTLFFAWGFATSLIDPLIAAVKGVFDLNYTEALLTQFAWFTAYGIVSLPAAAVLARLGYAKSIVGALAVMVVGALIVPLSTLADFYPGVLVALFVIAAGVLLSVCTACAAILCLIVSQTGGVSAAFAALAVGLFNSIMFPAIFTLTLERSSASASATSGLLCMAIIGGAILPLVGGMVADTSNLNMAFLIPAAGYVILTVFAVAAARTRAHGEDVVAAPAPH